MVGSLLKELDVGEKDLASELIKKAARPPDLDYRLRNRLEKLKDSSNNLSPPPPHSLFFVPPPPQPPQPLLQPPPPSTFRIPPPSPPPFQTPFFPQQPLFNFSQQPQELGRKNLKTEFLRKSTKKF